MRFAWGNETMVLPDQKEATDNKTVQTLLSLLKSYNYEHFSPVTGIKAGKREMKRTSL